MATDDKNEKMTSARAGLLQTTQSSSETEFCGLLAAEGNVEAVNGLADTLRALGKGAYDASVSRTRAIAVVCLAVMCMAVLVEQSRRGKAV